MARFNFTIDAISDPEELARIEASGRERGIYDEYLKMIVDAGVPGHFVDYENDSNNPLYKGEDPRKPQTVKTGFEGAIKRLSDPDGKNKADADRFANLKVRLDDNKVYVLNPNVAA